MPKPFKGVVNVDIRDSVPDWEPFLQPKAPEGAPNVLMIVWDDVGYGAMDVFGGPIETPTMRRIADSGLRYSNFHTTALCSPTRSSLLTGRNATSNNMACITEGSAGFPGFSARIPFENGTIAEVLNERGWNTYAIGKWHLTPGGRDRPVLVEGPLAAGPRLRALLRLPRRRDEPVVSGPRLRQPHGRAARAPEDGYHLSKDLTDKAIEFVRDAKAVAPEKPWFMYFCPGCAHAPHHVFKEWADKYKGRFDEGYEAIRADDPRRARRSSGCCPTTSSCRRSTRTASPTRQGPDGQPWPQLDFVRPWDSLTDDEQRLFARMAEVYAGFVSYTDDQIGRLHRLPRGVRAARQHDHRRRLRQRRQRRGRPERLVQREQVLQQRPRLDRGEPRAHRRARRPESYNHYHTGWAWAFDTPFPYWKRFAGYEGGMADPLLVSWPKGIAAQRRGAPPVRARGRRRPDPLRPARHRAAGGAQGLHAEPDRGRELRGLVRRPAARRARDPVLLDARHAGALPPGLAREHAAPADLGLEQASRTTTGSSTTSRRTAPRCTTSPPSTPSSSRS